jgi:hypothetical protein
MGDALPWAQLAFLFRVRNKKRILLARAPIVGQRAPQNLEKIRLNLM